MMDEELRQLFDIKEEHEIQPSEKKQNVRNHILIRLSILIAGTVGFIIAMCNARGWDALGYLFFMFAFQIIWLVFMLIEAFILHINKKYILRNINFIFAASLLAILSTAYIVIFK